MKYAISVTNTHIIPVNTVDPICDSKGNISLYKCKYYSSSEKKEVEIYVRPEDLFGSEISAVKNLLSRIKDVEQEYSVYLEILERQRLRNSTEAMTT